MAEVLPATADAWDYRVSDVEIPNEGTTRTRTETGTVAAISARLLIYRAEAASGSTEISSLVYEEASGRASLTISYDRDDSDIRRLGVQELSAVDVVRDIKTAKYFETLTNAQVAEVQQYWDSRKAPKTGWSELQLSLYGHMAHGQESYVETAYEFRQTFQTTSAKALRKAAADPNTVQELPELSHSLENLIASLPDGEWLKKPVTVLYAGRKGWTVTLIYQWAPKWSVVYGGTFTGLDAAE